MKNNPVFPYILILAFGIGLIFFMSVNGAGKSEEAEGGETTEQGGGAELVASCISCHGGDLTGAMGPNLVEQDPAHIVDVLVNGLEGSNFMTPNMKSEAEAQAIADYISSLK
ncbi:c-type cytochrome [Bacillus ndiopicus]|uniref:c-type cytochrome n=1 Tax=Bacillus ndiopicus TaxID=1347368 RepID=UPI0005A8B5C6|nr:cytochrome c [Bacillus ndiopicus]